MNQHLFRSIFSVLGSQGFDSYPYQWGVPKMGDPQVTMGFNTKSWSNLDYLGVPSF